METQCEAVPTAYVSLIREFKDAGKELPMETRMALQRFIEDRLLQSEVIVPVFRVRQGSNKLDKIMSVVEQYLSHRYRRHQKLPNNNQKALKKMITTIISLFAHT